MALADSRLQQLADAYGIATEFWDWKGRLTQVSQDTVVAVLRALDVDASTPEALTAALAELSVRHWRTALPPCVVTVAGRDDTYVSVHVEHGRFARLTVRLEEGGERETRQVEDWSQPRWVGDKFLGQATFRLPGDLPLGYHRLRLESEGWTAESTLIVAPAFLGLPAALGAKRAWGYATQLYSVRSADSWGMGDLTDLGDLAIWSATQQFASYILVNPLHAAEPMAPVEPSPYLPSSRRYVNPLYLRPESVPEYALLDERARRQIQSVKAKLLAKVGRLDRIERNPIWEAKLTALRLIFDAGRTPARQMSLDDFVRREGRGLTQFATWCALVGHLGMNWREWPAEYRRPSSPAVAEFAATHEDEVDFFVWLQWIADNQLSSAQLAAKDAGMRVGIVNDLAVGVSKESAEAWVLGDAFAQGVEVGAPPDHYNQLGQSWGQAPWRPDRLEDLSFAPFRAMVAGILRHAGGVRIDHIMGLFRLWWIPEGMSPREGTYVRYPHEALVGIVVLEALRAGALVVGEDLGTVEPWVRDYLRGRGILGTSVAWFEATDDGWPLPPERYREYCMASVTTHDMPPTAGYLAKDHIELQRRLGLLTEDVEVETAAFDAAMDRWRQVLRDRGLYHEGEGDDDVEAMVLALHRYVLQSPARVVNAALVDAVGDRRTQNQPGTIDEYPNWRVPLSGPDGRPLMLEEVFHSQRAQRLASVMNGFSTPLVGKR
nr:4-alpha-glucanotransferase [Propionibacterium sp.]